MKNEDPNKYHFQVLLVLIIVLSAAAAAASEYMYALNWNHTSKIEINIFKQPNCSTQSLCLLVDLTNTMWNFGFVFVVSWMLCFVGYVHSIFRFTVNVHTCTPKQSYFTHQFCRYMYIVNIIFWKYLSTSKMNAHTYESCNNNYIIMNSRENSCNYRYFWSTRNGRYSEIIRENKTNKKNYFKYLTSSCASKLDKYVFSECTNIHTHFIR